MFRVFLGLCLIVVVFGQYDNVNDFDKIDLDRNGELSIDEFAKWHTKIRHESNIIKSQRLFHSYDTNQDGALTVSEFVPLAYTLSRAQNTIGESLFRKLDTNNDGFLTQDEAQNSNESISKDITAGIFQLADINGDGKVALKEFLAVVDTGRDDNQEAIQNRGIAQSLIAQIDQNNDGKLSRSEIRTFANQYNKASEQEISTVFEILDENRDGQIELKELQKLPIKVIALAGIHAMPTA